jgi:hypothetical protein
MLLKVMAIIFDPVDLIYIYIIIWRTFRFLRWDRSRVTVEAILVRQ